jgi:Protein of unknown function DUF115
MLVHSLNLACRAANDGRGVASDSGSSTVNGNRLMKIGDIETYMATPLEEVLENIKLSLKRDLPEIENLPEFGKDKHKTRFAIAGGGPSIRYTVDTLRNFPIVCVAGSSHDWLVAQGIKPSYCLILDPDPISANYLKTPVPTCNYLVASCCAPIVFDTLKDYPVTRWHCAGPDMEFFVEEWKKANLIDKEGKKPIIGGGCTCGLRAISIGMVLGYRNMHFFGLDSNLDFNDYSHHAYEFVDPVNEHLGDVIEMRLGNPYTGRRFRVAKYMLAQLYGFKELVSKYGHHFDVTVHGDSITYEFMRLRRLIKDDKELAEALRITPENYMKPNG